MELQGADRFEILWIADLPGGRSLCAACHLGTEEVHWITCHLDEPAAPDIVTFVSPKEALPDIPTFGTSLAAIVDAALESNGAIDPREAGRFADLLRSGLSRRGPREGST